jgi:hypothetical protein
MDDEKLKEYSTLADDLGQAADAKIAIAYWGSRHASQAIGELVAEVRRLQKIEAALIDAKKWKRTQEAVLKATAKEDRMIWQVESAHENEREARMLGESAEELERILEGKGIA